MDDLWFNDQRTRIFWLSFLSRCFNVVFAFVFLLQGVLGLSFSTHDQILFSLPLRLNNIFYIFPFTICCTINIHGTKRKAAADNKPLKSLKCIISSFFLYLPSVSFTLHCKTEQRRMSVISPAKEHRLEWFHMHYYRLLRLAALLLGVAMLFFLVNTSEWVFIAGDFVVL